MNNIKHNRRKELPMRERWSVGINLVRVSLTKRRERGIYIPEQRATQGRHCRFRQAFSDTAIELNEQALSIKGKSIRSNALLPQAPLVPGST